MSQPRYPNQQPGPFQPQWGVGAPGGGFSHPQQQGAWGGQWQQQPPPPAPHQQQSGFYAPQPPQGGFPHQQLPPTPQFGPASQRPLAPAQAFAHQQQLLAMQQQRQMAYIQEQQRLAREEQRKREFEIQKRRLQHISVVNPAAANPLDDLFGKKLPTVSPVQGTMPSGSSTPSSNSSTPPPPPSQPTTVTLTSEPPQGVSVPTPHVPSQVQTGSAEADLRKQKREVQPTKPDTAETYKKLMTESLSNLSGPAPPTRKKMEFKTPSTALKASPHVEKSFTPSSKSRAWSANASDFTGVFAVHQQQQPQQQQEDDSFGEFHSSADNNFGEFHSSGHSSSTGSSEQNVFQAAPVYQPQQPLGVHPPVTQHQSSLGQGSFVPGIAGIAPSQVPPPGLGSVTPTSSYTHPIAAAIVSGPVSNTVTSSAPHHLQFRAHGDSSASAPSDATLNVAVPNLPPSNVPSKLDSSRFPPVYSEVYKQCCVPGDSFVRTDLLLPILTSSQLPQRVLRDLWTIANKSVPGKLNQTELYVLLGLIGLAQTGHPSPSMDALKSAPHPPVPRFSALPEVALSTTPGPPSTKGDLQAAGDFGEFHGMAPPTSSLAQPTLPPTQTPSLQPSLPPTQMPSLQPTLPPTQTPSLQPTLPPTQTPSLQPSLPPTQMPSLQPTLPPTQIPSLQPTLPPTQTPSLQPTLPPTQMPSLQPTLPPTQMPSLQPTLPPTQTPSLQPTLPPTQTPSLQPVPPVLETAPYQPTASAVLLPVNPDLPVLKGAPLVPEAVTQANDKYSAFEELRGIGLTSVEPKTISIDSGVTLSTAVTQPTGEKYTAFDELRQLSNTNTGQETLVMETQVMPSLSSSEDTFGPFMSIPPPLPSVTAIPQLLPHPSVADIPQPLLPVSTGTNPADASSVPPNVGNARAGDFSALTGHTSASTTSTLSTAQANGNNVTSTTDNLFASFGSDSQKHSTDNESWADFSNFTTVQPVGAFANVATIPQTEAVPVVPHSQTTSGLESFAATVEVAPGEEDRKPRSRSIGMEILQEELEGDTDTETLQPPPPVDFSQPLVPETVTHAKGGDEDFGEFEVYGNSSAQQLPLQTKEVERGFPTTVWKPPLKSPQVDHVRILTTCLSKCEEVLEQSARVFAEVKEPSLLQEICEVEEGRNKLRGIVEVYRLAKRVFCSLMHTSPDAVNDRQVKNIQKQWKTLMSTLPNSTMEKLYSQTAVAKVEEESDVLSDTISRCSICLLSKDVTVPSPHSLDTQREEYSLPLLFHQGQSYHPTCANFWYNAVREELPTQ